MQEETDEQVRYKSWGEGKFKTFNFTLAMPTHVHFQFPHDDTRHPTYGHPKLFT